MQGGNLTVRRSRCQSLPHTPSFCANPRGRACWRCLLYAAFECAFAYRPYALAPTVAPIPHPMPDLPRGYIGVFRAPYPHRPRAIGSTAVEMRSAIPNSRIRAGSEVPPLVVRRPANSRHVPPFIPAASHRGFQTHPTGFLGSSLHAATLLASSSS
jgi:hypothetical protein